MLKGFVSYSHADAAVVEALKKHFDELERQGLIRFWTDQSTRGGAAWERKLAAELLRSDVVLILMSPDALRGDSYLRNTELPAAEFLLKAGRIVVWPVLVHEVPIGVRFPWNLELLPSKPPGGWLSAHKTENAWCNSVSRRIALEVASGTVRPREHSSETTASIRAAMQCLDKFESALADDSDPGGFLKTIRLTNALRAALEAPVVDFIGDLIAASSTLRREFGEPAIAAISAAVSAAIHAARSAGYPEPIKDGPEASLSESGEGRELRQALGPKVDIADDNLQLLKQQRRGEEGTAQIDSLIKSASSIADRKLDLVRGLIEADQVDIRSVANTATDLDRLAAGFAAAAESETDPASAISRQAGDFQRSAADLARSAETYVLKLRNDDRGSASDPRRTDEESKERQALDLILRDEEIPAELAKAVTHLRFPRALHPGFLDDVEWASDACSRYSDLTSVRVFENLRQLDLRTTAVRDLGPLAGMPIRQLGLSGTKVADLTPLQAANTLEMLDISHSRIRDLSKITGLTSLRSLIVGPSASRQQDLSPLREFTKLEDLTLAGRRQADITPIGSMRSLRRLRLEGAVVDSFAPLGNLVRLETLALGGSHERDSRPLVSEGAVNLYLTKWKSDLTWIESLTRLKSLDIRGLPVASLKPLSRLTELRSLSVSGAGSSDISPLADLEQLDFLTLEGFRALNIQPLVKLTKLRRLRLSGFVVKDLSPLRQLTSLEWLDISGSPITDHRAVAHIPVVVGQTDGAPV